MTYQVLARKWRPKDFASLVGQEHVVRALTHALDGGRLHHAYLFTGTRGVGKTTLSRIFAKALNCETGVTATPCGVCRACREIDEGRFVDYVEMDAASNRGVDEMAALLERAVYAPVDARFKVYMIDEVHMLTNHAFNAMLKTLEEPPAHVKFILATTDPQKIPVTVLSRCLQFNLKQMPAGHIVSHLERILGEEKIPFEAQALRLLARSADGSMRDALSLTDQAIAYSANQVTEEAVRGMLGALDQSYLIRLLDALAAGDGAGVLAVADEMALRSLSFPTALQDLASLLHRVGWAQFAPSSVLEEWPEAADLRRFADMLSPEQVQLFYQIATIGRSELGLAPDEYAGFTMTLLRMLAFEPAPNGGGGGGAVPAARSGTAGSAEGTRTAVPTVAARQGAAAEPVATAAAPARAAEPARLAVTTQTGNATQTSSAQTTSASPVPHATEHGEAGSRVVGAGAAASDASTATIVEGDTQTDISGSKAPAGAGTAPGGAPAAEANAAETAQGVDAAASSPGRPAQEDATPPAARDDSRPVPSFARAANGASASTPAVAPAAQEDSSVAARQTPPPAGADAAPRRAGGASAALDVLRSAGLKVSSDRGRAAPAAPSAPAPKPAAPRVNVPGAPLDRQGAASAPARPQRKSAPNAAQGASSVPPWEDIPLDDYMPASADDAYFGPLDDGYVPVFDSGPDDVRLTPAAPTPVPVVDTTPLPPAIPLDAIGFDGDWPALAVGLALKGISYQLAFNSELISLDGGTLRLNVPVPQYADPAQVAKLKTALAERLGQPVDVQVEVGRARRTAAALDAIARAQRQQDAEREIRQDPFVQSLIRDFGASIVPDSIRPIAPEGGQGAAGGAAAAH
ncbi:DNA polymerase III subunit gamma/tau [Paraburkholderia sp. BL10I2N1]|uniref:DNA polymerase III subunit gamma/tau n=1 Tax=Paraburkholderia sp. BL10I2N1 TaxID=1938796 RepID=UPI001060C66F|nr:DNA polymerase III subunit gamma/tau [Paraburkholderia sp. BL10I2N1]TDN70300.1 DNA polymerase III gamma subunit /DNA polymerase III tau subunit [Paraburkholderia sp. BL10I2N1]